MFVDKIINNVNYKVVSDKLENIKHIYSKSEKVNDDFGRNVIYGLRDLVSNRVFTDIPKEADSIYYIGIHPGGLGFYKKHIDYRSSMMTCTCLPILKDLCTDEVVSILAHSIKKKNKQIRFLDVVNAIKKYKNEFVNVKIDHDLIITDIRNSLDPKNGEIIISDFQIMYGRLDGDIYTRILNDMDNTPSNFLIFEQLLDEIIYLEKKYLYKMEEKISKNEIVLNDLKNKLSGYFAAIAI